MSQTRKWTPENFQTYHENNPEVWELFEKYALQAASHRARFGARAVIQRMRWASMIRGDSQFKIDDGWCSHYARMFARAHPIHKDFFEFRLRKDSYHKDGHPVEYCDVCRNLLVQAFDYQCPTCYPKEARQ